MRVSLVKVELYAAIRRDHRDGLSGRALERKYGVTWRTVRKALDSRWPEPRKKQAPRASRLDAYKAVIDGLLEADLDAPPKQKHTVKRIFDRLLDEHAAAGISYQMVRAYVAVRRKEIRWEAGRGPAEVFVPQSHMPGGEAEVDFGDVHIVLAGVPTRCYLFSLRLSYSGKAVHRVSASCGQEAFFEGHVHALSVLGGVPRGKIRYDNLKAAVAQVLGFSRQRQETERWVAFRSHWGIESFYCRPGIEGAHEKGGVEGQIGYFRRNHFVPVPEVSTLAELNEMVDRWDREDEGRRIRSRPETVGEYFAVERPLLKPLPVEPFETGRWFTPRVDRYAQITVRTNRYSVPVHLIGKTVRVLLHASELVVFDEGREVARHERLSTQGGSRLVLDHYLEALVRKPGAFPGSTALEQARAAGRFTSVHDAWWDAARAAHGDKEGTQALIQVLLLARHIRHEHLMTGLAVALRAGALTADAVALEARKAADGDTPGHHDPAPAPPAPVHPGRRPGAGGPARATVTFLAEWRLSHLPPDTRPLPSVTPYDQLLRRRGPGRAPGEGEAT
ncbi:IS21 family transposase [Streptomyces chrestomyceticus]|uniref:IS21 family transposase n=1 Tax=Streptomyces chrestomyceticus TaxID=68185 RepID=UPI0019CF846E|nr:IS21 family transposase [Streptomyces chrestomyceticus]